MKRTMLWIACILFLVVCAIAYAEAAYTDESLEELFAGCSETDLIILRDKINEELARRQYTPDGMYTYILNVSKKKFHSIACYDAAEIKIENRQILTNVTREELIALNFKPCGNCTP